jgi:Telomeric single stranded DNA binding POT1/CDC13
MFPKRTPIHLPPLRNPKKRPADPIVDSIENPVEDVDGLVPREHKRTKFENCSDSDICLEDLGEPTSEQIATNSLSPLHVGSKYEFQSVDTFPGRTDILPTNTHPPHVSVSKKRPAADSLENLVDNSLVKRIRYEGSYEPHNFVDAVLKPDELCATPILDLTEHAYPEHDIRDAEECYFSTSGSILTEAIPKLAIPGNNTGCEPSGELPQVVHLTPQDEPRELFPRHHHNLTTSISYYTCLSHISDHLFQHVDVLAVCLHPPTNPKRAKRGPNDFYCTLRLVDPSLERNKFVTVQIFRPYKCALPAAERGNVVLFRDVKVTSRRRNYMLLSTFSSAWAVFSHPSHSPLLVSMLGVDCSGPPVEYGFEERLRAIELLNWWRDET